MKCSKKILAGVLTGALVLGSVTAALAATVHYNDSSVTGGSAQWQAWVENWDALSGDYTQVALTPGKNETELNFAWYAEDKGEKATPVVHFGTDKDRLSAFTGVSAAVDDSLTGGKAYTYNHVTVTGLKENTTYYYTVEKNGVQTQPEVFQTHDFSTVKMLYVGDPQVGASKGQPQGGEKLVASSGAANTAARNDGFAWDRTLKIATAQTPDLSFVISAGDQVNKTGKPKEEEYAAYLAPKALKSLPVATTIGNHDSLNPDYMYHFNTPNATQYGATQAGGDYYYSYGAGLFIVLNTNNYNVAEHEKAIAQAVASDPDAVWRVVTIHQDIYGTGLDHSDTDGMILRTQLTPIFDRYDIDVVLQGHDHTYSRSKLLYGDGQTHSGYEFQLNADGSDYDWDHAYNVTAQSQIPLSPADASGAALLTDFQEDNLCYTIESTQGNTAVNPKGTLYMSANSASGSKFYELIAPQQDYIAQRSQNWLPSYSVITMSDATFAIDTYQITESGKSEAIDQTFTIQKDKARPENPQEDVVAAASIEMDGVTYYRLRDVAYSAGGTASRFNVAWDDEKGVVITTGAAYQGYRPTGASEGQMGKMDATVNGKAVSTQAVVAGGNWFVPASFLTELGVTVK